MKRRLLLFILITAAASSAGSPQVEPPATPAGLIAAAGHEAWRRAQAAARRAGYDFSDVGVDRVYLQTPGTRVPKDRIPEGAVVLRPRALERGDDSLIDYAVDEKYGGDRALKLAIKAINRLLQRQRQELQQLRKEGRLSTEAQAEIARRLLE